MKVREAIRLLEADGWFLVATRGSHRQYKHPTKAGRVTVAGNHRMTWRRLCGGVSCPPKPNVGLVAPIYFAD